MPRALRNSEADRSYREAFDAAEQLVKYFPDVADYKSLWGMILGGRSWLALSQRNDPGEARRLVEQAIVLQRAALKKRPAMFITA